jgi:zinc transport system permease protein
VIEFLTALRSHTFLQYALLAGVLASVACGMMGAYVVTRRITYIAGSISHCVLAGLGAARYFSNAYGWTFFTPELGALAAALIAAAIIGLVSLYAKQREDSVIGAVWALGIAIGVLFIAKTPGYNEDLMSYLFGNILMVTRQDLMLIIILDAVVISLSLLFFQQLQALCFDQEFARLRGIRVEAYYLLLLLLVALTVVLLVRIVGIVLVIALLTLPAAIAGQFSRTLGQMMIIAILLSTLFTVAGLAFSYGPDLPAGATIIAVAGAAYIAVLAVWRQGGKSRAGV